MYSKMVIAIGALLLVARQEMMSLLFKEQKQKEFEQGLLGFSYDLL